MQKVLIIFSFLSLLVSDYGGGYAGAGYRYPSNARDLSLASAGVAQGSNGFVQFSNPALLPTVQSWQLGLSYQYLSLDRSIQVISIAKKLPPSGGLAVSFYRAGTSSIYGRDEMNNITTELSASDYAFLLSFGVAPSKRLSVGLNVKVMFSDLIEDIDPGNGVGIDIGLQYQTAFANFGFKYENVMGKINWKMSNGNFGNNYTEIMPSILSIGTTLNVFDCNILIQNDIIMLPNEQTLYRTRIGSEYNLKNSFGLPIQLRGGLIQKRGSVLENESLSPLNFTPVFGMGIHRLINDRISYQLDYALDTGKANEGFSHVITWILQF